MKTIASFDIGTKNFAHYIEEFDEQILINIRDRYNLLPRSEQRRIKGPVSERVNELINECCKSGKQLSIGVSDISLDETGISNEIRKSLFNYLLKLKEKLDTVDIFLIEQQYFNTYSGGVGGAGRKKPGGEANVTAIKLAECLLTWLLLMYPEKEIIVFSSMYKTHILGAPEDLTKPQRKKWTVDRFTTVLEEKNDAYTLDEFKRYKKLKKQKIDDMADAALQCQSYKYKKYVLEMN